MSPRGGAGRGQGRKPRGDEAMSKMLRAPCTPTMHGWAEHVASSAGLPIAEWLRALVDRAVSEHTCPQLCRLIESDGALEVTHPPISSYTLGQNVAFHPGRGNHWHPGIVTRLESGLRPDLSAWHMIFVSSTRDLPDGEWTHSGAYQFEDHDNTRVRPADGVPR